MTRCVLVLRSSSIRATSIDSTFDTAMVRKAFVMMLKPGSRVEYERRHNPIWPELEKALKEHGVSNYSIFCDDATDRLLPASKSNWKSAGSKSPRLKSVNA